MHSVLYIHYSTIIIDLLMIIMLLSLFGAPNDILSSLHFAEIIHLPDCFPFAVCYELTISFNYLFAYLFIHSSLIIIQCSGSNG